MSTPGGLNTLLLASAAEAAGYEIERSLRFNSSDSAYLNATLGTATDQDIFTLSMWVKRSALGSTQQLFGVSTNHSFGFTSSDALNLTFGGSSALTTTALFRDPSAWYHVVWEQNGTAHELYVNNVSVGTATATSDTFNTAVAHQIGAANTTNYFNGYLADIHFIDGQALDPTSFGEFDDNGIWQPIAYSGTYGTNGFHLDFADNSTAAALGYDAAGSNDWTVNNISPGSLVDYTTNIDLVNGDPIRSTDNIYDIFDGNTSTGAETNDGTGNSLLFDFANGTGSIPVSSNIQVWVGGSDGRTLKVNGSVIATNTGVGNNPHTITGQSQLDSVEVVSEVSSRSGFLLQIAVDGTALVSFPDKDNDSLVDVPTNGTETDTGAGGEVRGNYCTLNTVVGGANVSDITFSNGNLEATWTATAGTYAVALGTIGVSSGKWYWETTIAGASNFWILGIATAASSLTNYIGAEASSYSYYSVDGTTYNNGSSIVYGNTYTTNDVIGVALDLDNGRIFFSKNGTWQNSGSPTGGTNAAYTGLSGTFFPAYSEGTASAASSYICNFGQRPFAYTAPSGFKALCTANLPTPTIEKGSDYFDTTLYTGNGSTQTISGLGFSPDLVWIKARSTTYFHRLFDAVRPLNAALFSNSTSAEVTSTLNDNFTSFNSDGFSLGATSGTNGLNANGETFVAWAWDAGSSNATNTDGTITSTVRANPSAGFSIVSYTGNATSGATVGHGLGVAPSFIIIKNRSTAVNWIVGHSSAGWLSAFEGLNTTNAFRANSAEYWNNTAPTSSVITLGNGGHLNGSGASEIAYAFAPVAGYSTSFSYTGNGNADGPFSYLGFLPKLILIKCSSTTGNWVLLDTEREGYNVDNDPLFPNLSNAEATTDLLDITSNGFKLRSTDADVNANAATYVGYAWAESPFQFSRAR